jgi:deoxyadenosine/deoxycytidine kinase
MSSSILAQSYLEAVYSEITKCALGLSPVVVGCGDAQHREKRIISIEGNIGAGKSTLLEQIRQKIAADPRLKPGQIVCMQEPVDLWESVKENSTGESILKKFYKEPAKYAFAFQVMAYTSRLAAFQRIDPDCEVILCERSLEADRNIFAKMLRDDGMIDEVSYKVYQMLYDNTAGAFPIDKVIYLDVSPTVCLERIGRRARDGEGQISLEYLTRCDEYYKEWMRTIDRPVGTFYSPQMTQVEDEDDDACTATTR